MAVSRATVIDVLGKVLKSTNVSFSVDGNSIIIVKDGVPEVTILPEMVPHKLLHRFQYKYNVKIEFFFHPEMCHDQATGTH